MPIMVLTVPATGCCRLDLSPQATIADLKELIALKLDIDQLQQMLLFRGKQLQDEAACIHSLGIGPRSVVYVISTHARRKMTGLLTVVVRYRTQERSVKINTSEPLQKLESAAVQLTGRSSNQIALIYCGAIIRHGCVLDHKIVDKAIVLVKTLEFSRIRKQRNKFCSKSQIWEAAKLISEEELDEPEEVEQKLQPIKEAESIDDIDDEIFNQLKKLEEDESDLDSLGGQWYAPQDICKNMSTRSTANFKRDKLDSMFQYSKGHRTDHKQTTEEGSSLILNSPRDMPVQETVQDNSDMTMWPSQIGCTKKFQDTYTPAAEPTHRFQDFMKHAGKKFHPS